MEKQLQSDCITLDWCKIGPSTVSNSILVKLITYICMKKSIKENPDFFTFDGLDNEASCGEERMNITVYIQTWWPLTSNNIPLP